MHDVRQIAFVARRFEDLKGLITATIGAGLLFGSVAGVFLSASSGYGADPFQGAMFASMVSGLVFVTLGPRYRETFGRVQPSRFDLTSLAAMPLFGMTIGALVDLTGGGRNQWPSYAALGVALSSAAVLIRDGRWRLHYLIPLAAGLVGAAVTAAVPPLAFVASYERDPRRGPVYLFAYAVVGLSLIAAGLLDHLLLVRTLGPLQQQDRRGAAVARMRTAGLHTRGAAMCAAIALVTLAVPTRFMTMMLPVVIAGGFLVLSVGRAFVNVFRLLRRFPYGIVPREPLAFDAGSAAAVFVISLAAFLDATRLGAFPTLTAAAIAAASVATAVRDWPWRRHYLLGAAAALSMMAIMPLLSSAAAFTALLFAASAALTLETRLDARAARKRPAVASGIPHADTI